MQEHRSLLEAYSNPFISNITEEKSRGLEENAKEVRREEEEEEGEEGEEEEGKETPAETPMDLRSEYKKTFSSSS